MENTYPRCITTLESREKDKKSINAFFVPSPNPQFDRTKVISHIAQDILQKIKSD